MATDLCTGGTAFASSEYSSSYIDDYAFDDTVSNIWGSKDGDGTEWIGYAFSSAEVVDKVRIQGRNDAFVSQTPIQFEIRAGNSQPSSASDGDLLKSVSGLTWSSGEWKEWEFNNNTSYTHYWIVCLDNDRAGNIYSTAEIEMLLTSTVSTDPATNITASSATLNGTLDNLGGNPSLDVYFEWGTTTSYGNTTSTQTLSSIGSFSDSISGLSHGTQYHYRAVATDGSSTWYGSDVTFTTILPITDFNRKKLIDVASVSGTPTISRTQCLKIVGGADSTTGTGDIVLDWTNIATQADIGIYDENDNPLDYYFESFDDTAETAVIWVYRAWVQDGSTQAQVAYGNGPSDQSAVASTVFDKESGLVAGYLFNEASGDLLDVTSNNNDGTVTGATQGVTGQVGDAYSFDGVDDYIDLPAFSTFSAYTISAWSYHNTPADGDKDTVFTDRANNMIVIRDNGDGNLYFYHKEDSSTWHTISSGISSGTWHHSTLTWDGSTLTAYVDGVEINSIAVPAILSGTSKGIYIGGYFYSDSEYLDGIIDNMNVYNSSLSSDDISALYAATKSTPDFFSQQAGQDTGTTAKTWDIGGVSGAGNISGVDNPDEISGVQ